MYLIITQSELEHIYGGECLSTFLMQDQEELKKALYAQGMDTSKPIEIQEGLTSRDRFGKLSTGKRYVGFYRTDPDFIQSGYAPLEALYYASDSETRKILKEMNRSKDGSCPFEAIDKDELRVFLDEYTPIYDEDMLIELKKAKVQELKEKGYYEKTENTNKDG